MTVVIGGGPPAGHAGGMEPEPTTPDVLDQVARLHQELAERAAYGSWESVGAVLNLGTAVLLHGTLERWLLHPSHRLLDPAVIRELDGEHARLADDLETLDDLWRSSPGSPDVEVLAEALFRRLRDHLERDERTLYGPLARLRRLEAVNMTNV